MSERNEEEEDPRVRRVVISPGKQVMLQVDVLNDYTVEKLECASHVQYQNPVVPPFTSEEFTQ